MQDSKNLSKEEALSSLMDGEWSELSSASSIEAICGDKILRDKWARYHIIRDSLKGEAVHADEVLTSRIFSAIADEPAHSNVCAFGADSGNQAEPNLPSSELLVAEAGLGRGGEQVTPIGSSSAANSQTPSWLNTGLVGLSLAASVALVTVVGLNIFEEQGVAPNTPTVALNTDNVGLQNQTVAGSAADLRVMHVPEVELVANTGVFWVSPESSTRVVDEERLNMLLSRHIESSPTAVREGFLPYARIAGQQEAD